LTVIFYDNLQYETVLEETTRFGHFQNSLSDIDERNIKEQENGGSAVHGVTPFSDLSSTEFATKYLGFKATDSKKKSSEKVSEDPYMGSLTSVDWTGTLTTPVKDQGYCGSCW
jgi:cathepsin F